MTEKTTGSGKYMMMARGVISALTQAISPSFPMMKATILKLVKVPTGNSSLPLQVVL